MGSEEAAKEIQAMLDRGNPEELLALFSFEGDELVERVVFKFNLWGRHIFPKFFESNDAPFHKEIDTNNAKAYLGKISSFTDIAFRNAAKTTRTKLFMAYVVANDLSHRRKYLKVLSQDGGNSKQVVTDVYNLLIEPMVRQLYPEIFAKTETKREETMASFTTSTGVKMLADTVGSTQRGQIQDESRPDFVVFDDFETRVSLRSAVVTKAIWDNMEEARNGLAKDGVCIYLCNYLSERGNVHKLVKKKSDRNVVLIVPIEKDGVPAWNRYTMEEIRGIKADVDDYEGEYLCAPSASKDVMFDRAMIERMPVIAPIKEVGGFKIYKNYDPSHRYAAGADIAGGVGLDSSATVFIDFDTIPAQVVGVFHSNEIKPEPFGHEMAKEGQRYGECLIAPENNKFDAAITILKQNYPVESIYIQQRDDSKVQGRQSVSSMDYGWNTNALTKPKMILALAKAVEDGLISLNDSELIEECKSYTRNDLMDSVPDPRLATRHFDLVIALAIAWQMKDHAQVKEVEAYEQPPYEGVSEYETPHASYGQENIHPLR